MQLLLLGSGAVLGFIAIAQGRWVNVDVGVDLSSEQRIGLGVAGVLLLILGIWFV